MSLLLFQTGQLPESPLDDYFEKGQDICFTAAFLPVIHKRSLTLFEMTMMDRASSLLQKANPVYYPGNKP
jgi:hypothetical protein